MIIFITISIVSIMAAFILGMVLGAKSESDVWKANSETHELKDPDKEISYKVVTREFYIKNIKQKYKNYLR